jgi:hypothetical protein
MEFMNYVGSFIIKSDKSNSVLGDNTHNKSDCIRRDDDLSDSSENTTANMDISEKDDEKDFNSNINIYRYKFTNEFTNELFKFSKKGAGYAETLLSFFIRCRKGKIF